MIKNFYYNFSVFILGFIFIYQIGVAQNVGIGTATPIANLMISSNSGFANPQLLLRQTNNADWARLRMQTGSGRYWDIASLNGASQAEDRLNLYHSIFGDVITLSGNGFVGIGTYNPLAPLTFPATTGRKIVLYPAATGNVGAGVYNNELRLHTDYEPADITLGFENLAGVFTERFRFKGNGALSVQGNSGTAGQVLSSNGANAGPVWITPFTMQHVVGGDIPNNGITTVAGLTDVPGTSLTITISKRSRLFYSVTLGGNSNVCALCPNVAANVLLFVNNVWSNKDLYYFRGASNAVGGTLSITNYWVDLDPGTHNIKCKAQTSFGFDPVVRMVGLHSTLFAIPL